MNRFLKEIKVVEKMMIKEKDQDRLRKMERVIRNIKRYYNGMNKLLIELEDNQALEYKIEELHDQFTSYQDCYLDYIYYVPNIDSDDE